MSSPLHRARELFVRCFGREPQAAASAPGRVNLIGDHVDYCGGSVLPMAIDQRTAVCVGRGVAGRVRVVSSRSPDDIAVTPAATNRLDGSARWASYVAGAARVLEDQLGFDAAVAGDVPVGSGLSSSAALEVASLLAVEQLSGRPLAPLERALMAQRIEHECAGVPCGIMDQYAAVFARVRRAMIIDCRGPRHRELALPDVADVIIVDSGIRHELADAAYARRRAECESARLKHETATGRATPHLARIDPADVAEACWPRFGWSRDEGRRARHVVNETVRVESWARAIEADEVEAAGRLMLESHASLRDDFEVSCPEVDELVEHAARQPGVLGARMTGGGFGGCGVVLVRRECTNEVVKAMSAREPSRLVLIAAGGDGARIESLDTYHRDA